MDKAQIKYLRTLSQTMTPSIQVGKNGITTDVISQIKNDLEARELIKVKALENSGLDKKELAQAINEMDNSIKVINQIGKTVTLYRKSGFPKNQKISSQIKDL